MMVVAASRRRASCSASNACLMSIVFLRLFERASAQYDTRWGAGDGVNKVVSATKLRAGCPNMDLERLGTQRRIIEM